MMTIADFLSMLTECSGDLPEEHSYGDFLLYCMVKDITRRPQFIEALSKDGSLPDKVFMHWEYDADGNPVEGSGLARLVRDFRLRKDVGRLKKGMIKPDYVGMGKSYPTRESAEKAVEVIGGVEFLKVKLPFTRGFRALNYELTDLIASVEGYDYAKSVISASKNMSV